MFISSNDKVTLYLGPTASGKTEYLINLAAHWAEKAEPCLIIISSTDQKIVFRNKLLRKIGHIDQQIITIATFYGLVKEILPQIPDFPYSLSSGWQEYFTVMEVLNHNIAELRANILTESADITPGIANVFRSLFSEFSSALAFRTDFKIETAGERFVFLFRIYRQFIELLHEKGLCQIQEAQYLSAEHLEKTGISRFSHLIIDGFYEFVPIQEFITAALIRIAKDAHLSITYSEDLSVYEYVKNKLEIINSDFKTKYFRECRHTLVQVHNHLFEIHQPRFKSENHGTQEPKLTVHEFYSHTDELAFIRNSVINWLKQGIPAEEIAILTYNTGLYADRLSVMFSSENIPFNLKKTDPLSMNPAADFLYKLISVSASDFSRDAVTALLATSPFMISGDNSAENSRFSEEMLRFIRLCGIRKSLNDWTNKPDQTCEFYSGDTNGSDAQSAKVEEFINGFKGRARDFILSLKLPKRGSYKEYFHSLKNVLEFLSSNRYCSFSPTYKKELKAIFTLLMREFHLTITEQLTLSEFKEFLWLILSGTEGDSSGKSVGISFRDIMKSRGVFWKKAIFAGVNEGIIPGQPPDNLLLPNSERSSLNKAGIINLEDHSFFQEEQKLLFLMGLTRATDEIILTYHKIGDSGTEKLPSPYLSDLLDTLSDLYSVEKEHWLRVHEPFERHPTQPLDLTLNSHSMEQDRRIAARFPAFRFLIEQRQNFRNNQRNKGSERAEQDRNIFPSVISPSRLEAFTSCPFIHYARYILKLEKSEEPISSMLLKIEGEILHAVLAELTLIWLEREASVKDWSNWLSENGRLYLKNIISKYSNRYRKQNLFIHPSFWEYQMEQIQKNIQKFIITESEANGKDDDYHPYQAELSFGYDPEKTVGITLKDGSLIAFTGRIDRVDISKNGDTLRIIDYKRSKGASINKITEGKSFQFPVYLFALKQLFNKKSIDGAFYFNLRKARREGFFRVKKSEDDRGKMTFSEIEEHLRKHIEDIREKVNSGIISARPEKSDYCKPGKCEYFEICGFEKDINLSAE